MQVNESKAALRKHIRQCISKLDREYIMSSDALISGKLLSSKLFINADRVFLYYSVDSEVSTLKIIEAALLAGKETALPVSFVDGTMVFRKISGIESLKSGAFGIPEPDNSCPEAIPDKRDLMIVPALCCDRNGNRLGHGKGYYDRYLDAHPCISVCLCREKLAQRYVPHDGFDRKVSFVITEK